MAYAIMRTKKLRSMGSVAGSLEHCFRERETHNADPEKAHLNDHRRAAAVTEAMGALRERLPEKRRKDAVLAVEYFMGASPEWWQQATERQQEEFFARSVRWLEAKYGAENVLVASIHRDETSPHLSAYVIPMHEGKLSAKACIGGRDKMSRDQTSYAKALKDLGLRRGIEGSKAEHTSIKNYYGQLSEVAEAAPRAEVSPGDVTPEELPPESTAQRLLGKKRYESAETVAERLTDKIEASELSGQAKKAALTAQEALRLKNQLIWAGDEVNALRERYRAFIELDKLDPDEFAAYSAKIATYVERKKAAKAAEIERAVAQEKAEKAAKKQKEQAKKDFEKRIADLLKLKNKVGGMKATIVEYAHEAMREAGGDCWKVDWVAVMLAAAKESYFEHNQDFDEIRSGLEALAPLSPKDIAAVARAAQSLRRRPDDAGLDYGL